MMGGGCLSPQRGGMFIEMSNVYPVFRPRSGYNGRQFLAPAGRHVYSMSSPGDMCIMRRHRPNQKHIVESI